jgi:hypothetical protein
MDGLHAVLNPHAVLTKPRLIIADARLFRKNLFFTHENGSEEFKVLVGGALMTQTVHMLEDMDLAKRCLTHVKAVATAAHSDLRKRFEEFVRAGQQSRGSVYTLPTESAIRRLPLSPNVQRDSITSSALGERSSLASRCRH